MSALTDKLSAYGCDLEHAMERFLNDEDFYGRCFEKFLSAQAFEQLGEALAAGDAQAAFSHAHDLKGTSANMGVTPVYDLAVELVNPLRKGEIPANAQELYGKIMAIRGELQQYTKEQ